MYVASEEILGSTSIQMRNYWIDQEYKKANERENEAYLPKIQSYFRADGKCHTYVKKEQISRTNYI